MKGKAQASALGAGRMEVLRGSEVQVTNGPSRRIQDEIFGLRSVELSERPDIWAEDIKRL